MTMFKIRGFEPVRDADKFYLPERSTSKSAGYDFRLPEDVKIFPNEIKIIPTNIKAFMLENEYLQLSLRSSLGAIGLIMPNAPAIIDSDYYSNRKNDGNIGLIVLNMSNKIVKLLASDKVMQGVFLKYFTDGTDVTAQRTGGYGSTGK